MKAHRARQNAEKLLVGSGYADEDLVVADPAGHWVHPGTLSWNFGSAVTRHGLPPLSLHGLRHTRGTLAMRAGVNGPADARSREYVDHAPDVCTHPSEAGQADAAARIAAALEGVVVTEAVTDLHG